MRFLLLFTLCYFTPALAMAEVPLASGTRINLNVTMTMQVPHDEVVIVFRVEQEGRDASVVRQYVNKVSGAIQARLGKEQAVQLTTTSRQMQPIWKHEANKPRLQTGWRMLQMGQVISKNLDAVPAWLDAIEVEGAHLSSLQFRVSADTSKTIQDTLRLKAIAAFRDKAAIMAKGLQAESFRVIRLNTSSHAAQPLRYQPKMAMMSRSADAAKPSLAAGEGKLRLTINGEIETPFVDFLVP